VRQGTFREMLHQGKGPFEFDLNEPGRFVLH
jgi:hypothetical protein